MYYSIESLFEFSFSYERPWSFEVFSRDRGCSFYERCSLSQRKYLTDLLEETSTLESKLIDTPMDLNIHFDQNVGEPFADPGKYKQSIGKLIYLTVTQPDITFAVSVLSCYMQLHWTVICHILKGF